MIHSSRIARPAAAVSLLAAVVLAPSLAFGQAPNPNTVVPFLGRWDLVVTGPDGRYPSWLEITPSGFKPLVGRWVGRIGSARPIANIEYTSSTLRFAIPSQWEAGAGQVQVEGTFASDKLSGTLTNPDGTKHAFTATRAPSMRHATPAWGTEVALFNGKDLTGWTTQGGGQNNWAAVNGVLTNRANGANLMTTRAFGDFKLHVEFRYPKNGNSGVYLRGRHEVQIEDSPERDWPASVHVGGVYGFLVPNRNAAAGPGQWNTYDLTLVGRQLTLVLNGKTVIAEQTIPGITGGALDSNEGAPGPILLQGDHTAVEFRNIRITPSR